MLGFTAAATIPADVASAAPGDTTASASNGLALLTVTVHKRPYVGTFTLSGSLEPLTSGGDCVSEGAYLGWKADSTGGAFNTANTGGVKRFFSDFADVPASREVTVTAQGGCTGPDGLEPNLKVTLAIDLDALVTFDTEWVTGVAYLGDHPAPDATSYQPAAGVAVDLLDASADVAAPPVASAVTRGDGSYWMTLPVSTQAEADRHYRVRFAYPAPHSAVVYFDGGGLSAWQSSTSDAAGATDVGGPSGWLAGHTGLDAMLSRVSAPATTVTSRLCNAADSQQVDAFATPDVEWEGICETDPSVWGAALTSNGMTAALARIGTVWFDQLAGAYEVTADDFTTDQTGDALTTTLHDDGIYLADQDVTVDVTIIRTFQGSDARWIIEVRDADTGDLVDVPFSFGGGFQNDARTTWTSVDYRELAWVSDGGAWRASDAPEGILAHNAVSGARSVHTDFEGIQVDAEGGRLDYYLSVLDYTGCVPGAARTAARAAADALPITFGLSRAPLTGDACTVTWPAPALDPMRVGVPFEQTFTVASTDLGWSGGGAVWLEDLPSGLQFEAFGEYTPGVTPSFRIFGTPTTAGPFDITAYAMNAVYRQDATHLTGSVLTPPQIAAIALNISIGDEVAGATADVDGMGLKPGSSYSVIVESTPQLLGTGTIGADYLLDDTVTMPAGLETGWHSLTAAGTFADDAAATATLWFLVAADGTLAQVSPIPPVLDPGTPGGSTDPAPPAAPHPDARLASTGADASGGLTAALVLLLAGLALRALRRRARYAAGAGGDRMGA